MKALLRKALAAVATKQKIKEMKKKAEALTIDQRMLIAHLAEVNKFSTRQSLRLPR